MPKQRLSMRKLAEILRLDAAGLSARQIARSCGVARSTVAEHLERMKAAGVSWPFASGLKEAVAFAILVAVLWTRPSGLFGRAASGRA